MYTYMYMYMYMCMICRCICIRVQDRGVGARRVPLMTNANHHGDTQQYILPIRLFASESG